MPPKRHRIPKVEELQEEILEDDSEHENENQPKNARAGKKEDYECVRCGYTTKYKSSMRTHLYRNLKPCPGLKVPITMTDSMKEEILKNRKYEIKEYDNPNPIVNQFQNWIMNYM